MTRLEEIVRLLEDGKAGLDDALGRYEEGVGLLRQAYEMLEKAERKITLLTGIDSDGNPILRPMEDTASFPLAENANPATASSGKAAPRRDEPRNKADWRPGHDLSSLTGRQRPAPALNSWTLCDFLIRI